MNRNFLTFSLLACGKNVISVSFCRILNNSLHHCCFCYEIGSKLFGTSIEIIRSLTFKFDGRNNFCDLSWQLLWQWIYQKFSKKKKKKWRFLFFKSFWFHNNCHNCPKLWSSSFVVFNNSVLIFLVKSKQRNGENFRKSLFSSISSNFTYFSSKQSVTQP